MPGTFTLSLLADGQLAAAQADIYLVPAVTTAVVKTITLVNTNTTVETVNLYLLKASGTARRIIPEDMQLNPGYLLETDMEYTLGPGDSIQGDTTTASKVDFTVNGVEET